MKLIPLLQNDSWCSKCTYLADISGHPNKSKSSMQGRHENFLTSVNYF